MNRMVFAFLVAVFAQNAFSVEDTGYYCQLGATSGKENIERLWKREAGDCERGDTIYMSSAKPEIIARACIGETVVLIDRHNNQAFTCVYRGSLREQRAQCGGFYGANKSNLCKRLEE